MKCPFCGSVEDRVVDSRESREGEVIRRRRECTACQRRFTSYERVEEAPMGAGTRKLANRVFAAVHTRDRR